MSVLSTVAGAPAAPGRAAAPAARPRRPDQRPDPAGLGLRPGAPAGADDDRAEVPGDDHRADPGQRAGRAGRARAGRGAGRVLRAGAGAGRRSRCPPRTGWRCSRCSRRGSTWSAGGPTPTCRWAGTRCCSRCWRWPCGCCSRRSGGCALLGWLVGGTAVVSLLLGAFTAHPGHPGHADRGVRRPGQAADPDRHPDRAVHRRQQPGPVPAGRHGLGGPGAAPGSAGAAAGRDRGRRSSGPDPARRWSRCWSARWPRCCWPPPRARPGQSLTVGHRRRGRRSPWPRCRCSPRTSAAFTNRGQIWLSSLQRLGGQSGVRAGVELVRRRRRAEQRPGRLRLPRPQPVRADAGHRRAGLPGADRAVAAGHRTGRGPAGRPARPWCPRSS